MNVYIVAVALDYGQDVVSLQCSRSREVHKPSMEYGPCECRGIYLQGDAQCLKDHKQ